MDDIKRQGRADTIYLMQQYSIISGFFNVQGQAQALDKLGLLSFRFLGYTVTQSTTYRTKPLLLTPYTLPECEALGASAPLAV